MTSESNAASGPTAMDTDEGNGAAGAQSPPREVAGEADTGCTDRERFLLELEFVQVRNASHPASIVTRITRNDTLGDPKRAEPVLG